MLLALTALTLSGTLAAAAAGVDEENWTFGYAVAAFGDVDGDAKPDFAVAARGLGVRMFSGADGKLLWHTADLESRDELAESLANAGDVDGDKRDDVLAGVPHPAKGAGYVVLLSGATGKMLAIVTGPKKSLNFGAQIASFDRDQDGAREFAVSAPYGCGAVYLYSCATRALLGELAGESPNDRFGEVLTVVTNGLLISAPGARFEGRPERGRAALFDLRSLALERRFEGVAGDLRFGISSCELGDLDGDGARDLAFGVALSCGSSGEDGLVRLVSRASGKVLRELRKEKPCNWPGHLAAALAPVGDLDGDGHDDLAVSEPYGYPQGSTYGLVRFYSCTDGRELASRMWQGAPDQAKCSGETQRSYGRSLAVFGDVDGDAKPELLIGAPDSFWGGGVEVVSPGVRQSRYAIEYRVLTAKPGDEVPGEER